jgi:hypothetical protein
MAARTNELRAAVVALAIAATGTLAVYFGLWSAGFHYDDYHFVRPLSLIELRRVWYGSWDPSGAEAVFFRPLTAWWFAARFWLLGLNAPALHLLSLAGHVVCAVLLGWLLHREGVPTWLTWLGAGIYATHPVMPHAQVAWLTNQMHLAASLGVLIALLCWQTARRGRAWAWPAVAFIGAIVFLIKEDTIMLLPAVALMSIEAVGFRQWRKWLWVTGGAVALVLVLVLFRFDRLGELGGYGTPDLAQASGNFWKGLKAALLLWPTRNPWQAVAAASAIVSIAVGVLLGWQRPGRWWFLIAGTGVAGLLATKLPAFALERPYPLLTAQALSSATVTSLLLVGLGAAVWRRDRLSLRLLLIGVTVVVCFNLPFVLVSKREQYHLLALGAVIALSGAANAVVNAAGRKAKLLIGLLVVALLPLPVLAREQAADFAPCGQTVLDGDVGSREWWVVPSEIKFWFDAKATACKAGQPPPAIVALPIVWWGLYEEKSDGETFRWSSDHAVALLSRDVSQITVALRRPDASSAKPVHVELAGGARPISVELASPEWSFATIELPRNLLAWLRDGRRLEIIVREWFVPAVLDPHASDLRRFGVQVRVAASAALPAR